MPLWATLSLCHSVPGRAVTAVSLSFSWLRFERKKKSLLSRYTHTHTHTPYPHRHTKHTQTPYAQRHAHRHTYTSYLKQQCFHLEIVVVSLSY